MVEALISPEMCHARCYSDCQNNVSIDGDVALSKPAEPVRTGNERIFLIDDDEAMVDAVLPMLEYLGHEVVASTSSIEALEIFREQSDKFDLVITDQTMPKMTGKELAKELLDIRPDIPIILCTGFSEQVTEEEALALGISKYVMKPVVMREFAKTIEEVLGRW